jgi:1-acyl-sn-glycerol-3-phosphate acyltransferase
MFAKLRQRNPGEPLWKILWWEASRWLYYIILVLLYRYRCWGVRNIPAAGPVLLLSNHQSVLDLAVVGVGLTHRHFHPMAKSELFHNKFFAGLIRSYNAFPVTQDKADLKAVRTAIDLLAKGHLVLIFPEGSRTADGLVHDLQAGVMLIIRRAKPTIVPMAVEGPFHIWPMGQAKPKLRGWAGASYGKPIASEDLLKMPSAEASEFLRKTIDNLRLDLREKLVARSSGRYPPTN